MHALLTCWRVYPWWQDTGDQYPSSFLPAETIRRAGRADAWSRLVDQMSKACDAAGWHGGFVSAKGTNSPSTWLRFALIGAIISDLDPFRAALLGEVWADCMPPPELTSRQQTILWCRVRAGGATRDDAMIAVHGVFAEPVGRGTGISPGALRP